MSIVVTELNIYPIKSTAGIALAESALTTIGLEHDRCFMLVDESGTFMTGRQFPQLTQVRVVVEEAGLSVAYPDMTPLFIPFQAPTESTQQVNIWRDTCDAEAMGTDFDEWFSAILGCYGRLVRLPHHQARSCSPEFADGSYVSFADGFPILIISEASLADLNTRLTTPVDMRRFRPNIVVSGCDAYAEDDWTEFAIGALQLRGVKNCSRCVFTTVDPDTGVKDVATEPLKTLSQYRRRVGGVYLGQNVVPLSEGLLHLGDTVTFPG